MLMNVCRNLPEDRWFENVSSLRIYQFVEVVAPMRRKKIVSELLRSCIGHWTRKWLSKIKDADCTMRQKSSETQLHRVTIEYLIRILAVEENSVRVALVSKSYKATDLLGKHRTTLLDVNVVTKVVEVYFAEVSSNLTSNLTVIGRWVDEFLVLGARDDAMTRSFTAAGSNYQRTKSQAIMKVSKALGNGYTKSLQEIAIMKQDVERL
ncbi:uncharacterized protein [Coffea arabica]|uniref:NPH3 domain-containing protein n=1 Tax=Coffea arabica TaxID=13443 RepID=A0ABM4WQB3_COFAR